MKIYTHEFNGNMVSSPETWIDTTEDVNAKDAPFTLAKKDIGIGALQFSFALYKRSEEPNITISDLKEMLAHFAEAKELGESFDQQVYENRLNVVAASYHVESDLIRVWYCSDEKNIALITYVCAWDKRGEEIRECEDIIRTIRFSQEKSAEGKGDRQI